MSVILKAVVHSQIYCLKNLIKESWQHKTIYRRLQVLQNSYYVLYTEPVKRSLGKILQIWTFCHSGCHAYQTKERFTVPRIINEMHFPSQTFETITTFIHLSLFLLHVLDLKNLNHSGDNIVMLTIEDGVVSSNIIICNVTKMFMLQMEMGWDLKVFRD